MVGKGGFEPPASCSQSRRANQAALLPGLPLAGAERLCEGAAYGMAPDANPHGAHR